MAMFYEVILNGDYKGKDNLNTLYYRTALDIGGGAFGFGGAAELAEEVVQEIVPAFVACKPNDYVLQTVDIIPRNATFELLYQLPFRKEVNRRGTGWLLENQTDGPGTAVNIRFNLEPQMIGLQAFTAPKRGYISVGPIPSSWITDSGKLDDGAFSDPDSVLTKLCAALSQNLESIDPPCVWFPIRVSKHYGSLAGPLLGMGYADVMSASLDEYISFRRSRRITG